MHHDTTYHLYLHDLRTEQLARRRLRASEHLRQAGSGISSRILPAWGFLSRSIAEA